jgi:choloylglycine hydrolase
LADHIINNVDIPNGIARSVDNGKEFADKTQWVVFKDITHKVIYYRTYDNLTLRSLSLAKINFSKDAPILQMSLASPVAIQDMTSQFIKSH